METETCDLARYYIKAGEDPRLNDFNSTSNVNVISVPCSFYHLIYYLRLSGLLKGVGVKQHFTELLKIFVPPDFMRQKRHPHDVKIFVKLQNLIEVLLLHLVSSVALLTFTALLRIQELIYHNAVCVDLVACQLLNHPLCFIERQKLGNTYTYEACG